MKHYILILERDCADPHDEDGYSDRIPFADNEGGMEAAVKAGAAWVERQKGKYPVAEVWRAEAEEGGIFRHTERIFRKEGSGRP